MTKPFPKQSVYFPTLQDMEKYGFVCVLVEAAAVFSHVRITCMGVSFVGVTILRRPFVRRKAAAERPTFVIIQRLLRACCPHHCIILSLLRNRLYLDWIIHTAHRIVIVLICYRSTCLEIRNRLHLLGVAASRWWRR